MKTDTRMTQAFVMPSTDAIFRELLSTWGYDIHHLTDADKRKIGADLAKFMGRIEPLSRSYITNILAGRTGGEEVRTAIMQLLTIASGEARPEQVKGKPVEVIALADVHPGSLILTASRLCVCGLWFVPKCWNQKDHAPECRKMRRKVKEIAY